MSSSPPHKPKENADTGTVNRVLRILSQFSEKEQWGLNELARRVNLPRGTTHRLLNLCKPLSFVSQNEDGLYMPGVELYRLAGKLASEAPINQIAQPILRKIRDETDETILLTVLARNELKMYFSMSESPAHPLRYTIEKNMLQPLSWGSSALSLLAFLSEEEIEEVIRRAEPSPLDGRPMDAKIVRQQLEKIKNNGYALSFGQRAPEAHGVSVPFFDAQGEVYGNLTLTIPDFRYHSHDVNALVKLLLDSAATLTSRLGWS